MPSSGSLSVPLVSSAYINWRRRDRLVRSRGMGKTWQAIIRCRQQVFVSLFHFIADCDWPYVYHQKMGISTKRLNLILMCWCGWHVDLPLCVCVSPRTVTPWFFTLFLPRLSSKIVSILLTYYVVEAQVLVSPIILEPLQNPDYMELWYIATNSY